MIKIDDTATRADLAQCACEHSDARTRVLTSRELDPYATIELAEIASFPPRLAIPAREPGSTRPSIISTPSLFVLLGLCNRQ